MRTFITRSFATTLLTTTLFTAFSGAALAQSKEAEVSFMGNFSQEKTKGQPGTRLSGYLNGSYLFIIDQFEIGPSVSYSRYIQAGEEDYTYSRYGYGLGPKAKFNFANIQHDQIVPYAALTLMVSEEKSRDFYDGAGVATKRSTEVTPAAGISYFVSRDIALNAELGYKTTFSDSKEKTGSDDPTVKSTQRDMETSLTAGFSVFL